jgi:uncharacterized damage-inducible protein DinB
MRGCCRYRLAEGDSHVTTNDIQELYDYGRWANRKLLDAVSTLSAEEFTRSVGGSYGSIRTTLVHLLGAEWGWLARCGGPARGDRLKPEDYPTFESVVELARTVEGYERDFLPTLNDADLTRVVEFSIVPPQTYRMTVGRMLQHAAIHSIHHRGQAALLTRMLGHPPGNFDALFYYAGDVALR